MNKRALWWLVVAFLASGGSSKSSPAPSSSPKSSPAPSPKNSSKKDSTPAGILLLGDSQSVSPGSPGALLASSLGARRLAKGGKTAAYFASGGGKAALLEELDKRPRWVIVFLGSNELANVSAFPLKSGELDAKKALAQAKGHEKLKALIEAYGAKALFVGPPQFGDTVKSESGGQPLNNAAPLLVPLLAKIYSPHFIDARDLTPPHKGVHFFQKGEAKAFATALHLPILKAIQ